MTYLKRLYFIFLFTFVFSLNAQENYILGEYNISKIIDGDTFKFENLDKSARFLGIDAEETYKGKYAYEKSEELKINWIDKYNSAKSDEGKPSKSPSPFGYKTTQWTKELFKDVKKVRLETDGGIRTIDVFGRYLVYVIAIRNDGTEFNYNLECVKEGYSPYFCKYGYSARFDNEFRAAEKYAEDNKLGIWSNAEYSYPDYTERLEWWKIRAESILHFQQHYYSSESYFSFADGHNLDNMKNYINDTINIFGCSEIIKSERDLYLVKIKYNSEIGIDIVIFSDNKKLLKETGIGDKKNYYLYIRGKLEVYNGRYEIILNDKSQVWQE